MTRILTTLALIASLALAGCIPTGVRSLQANPEGGVDYQSDTRTPEQIAAGVKAEEAKE